jgi:hypothetical protein
VGEPERHLPVHVPNYCVCNHIFIRSSLHWEPTNQAAACHRAVGAPCTSNMYGPGRRAARPMNPHLHVRVDDARVLNTTAAYPRSVCVVADGQPQHGAAHLLLAGAGSAIPRCGTVSNHHLHSSRHISQRRGLIDQWEPVVYTNERLPK